jgi:hypothetical protein
VPYDENLLKTAKLLSYHTVATKDGCVTEFNHIHIRDGEDWVCGRTMAFEDRELIRCEARDPDEEESCRRCSEQILSYFGDAMHVQ